MHIYAQKVDTPLFGRKGSVVVYLNAERRFREMEVRNGMIFKIQQELAELQKTCSRIGRDTVIEKVDRIVPKAYQKFFRISVDDGEKGVSLVWEVNDVARVEDERLDGKYLLYASDPSLCDQCCSDLL